MSEAEMSPEQEKAETQAMDVLRFLADRPEDFGRFLALSGMEADDLAVIAGSPEFLAALVDFLRSDEELAAAYGQEAGLSGEDLAAMRANLPGGGETHWT